MNGLSTTTSLPAFSGGRKPHMSLVGAGDDNKVDFGASNRFRGISNYLGVRQICVHFLRVFVSLRPRFQTWHGLDQRRMKRLAHEAVSDENACRGERCGVWGRRAPSNGCGLFLLERFLFVFREELFLLGQSAIRKRTQRIGACIMTYSGREEERAPSIYRSSSLVALSGGVEGAPFQRVFIGARRFSSQAKGPPSKSVSVEP